MKKILKYIETAEKLEKYIINNNLKEGDKLPGGRYFSDLFNISKNTVYEAFGLLEDRDIISMEYKSCAVIKNIPNKSVNANFKLDWNSLVRTGWQRQSSRSFQKIYSHAIDSSYMFFNSSHLHPDFGYGKILKQSINNVMEKIDNTDLLSQRDNYIMSSLKLELAKRIDISNSHLYENNILISPGRYFAIDLVLQSILRSGSILYIESPSHIVSTSIVNSIGLNIIPVSMDNEGLNINELKRKYKKNRSSALFLSSRGNIVNNICLSKNRAQEILEFANDVNIPVIEMDYNSIYYPDAVVLKRLDTNNRVVYLSTLFASYTFGFDLCWISAPDIIYTKIRDNLYQYVPYQPSLELYVLEDMLRSGAYEKLLNDITPKLKDYKIFIDAAVNKYLSDYGFIASCPTGYATWFKINNSIIDFKKFSIKLEEYKISVLLGYFFGKEFYSYILIYPYSFTKEDIEKGIMLLAKVFQNSLK